MLSPAPEGYVSGATIEVFCSYSHKDESFREQLGTHVSLMIRQRLISFWHNRCISAGTEWKGQIDAHLNSADLILLLISADFIASDYCFDVEMKRAMERHEDGTARVIPIILRPVAGWEETPFGKLQAIPKDGKPVTGWRPYDRAFKEISHAIKVAVFQLLETKKIIYQSLSEYSGRKSTAPKQPLFPPNYVLPNLVVSYDLIINAEVEEFDETDQELLLVAIAHELDIPRRQLRIKAIKKHQSIKVTVELPVECEEDLLRAFEEGRLQDALEPIQLLDVQTWMHRNLLRGSSLDIEINPNAAVIVDGTSEPLLIGKQKYTKLTQPGPVTGHTRERRSSVDPLSRATYDARYPQIQGLSGGSSKQKAAPIGVKEKKRKRKLQKQARRINRRRKK